MKITKRELIICVCEVACIFLPAIFARVVLTLVKQAVRNTTDEKFDEKVKI